MKITDFNKLSSPAANDVIVGVDVSEDITKKIEVQDLPVSNATQTALDAKQDTLVSGTNLKTINSTSLLGSGDISIEANPSGGAGLIQFSDGSAFASDSNLYWDNTNKRLGIGHNAPTSMLHVKGSGTTSATTALLVQNSAGSPWLNIRDNGEVNIGGNTSIQKANLRIHNDFEGSLNFTNINFANWNGTVFSKISGISPATATFIHGGTSIHSSASMQIDSTIKGFLPPRMTTTQKNAISSPAAGLQVYDTTLNQMSYYNGTSWVNF